MNFFKGVTLVIASLLVFAILSTFQTGNAKPSTVETETTNQNTISVSGSSDIMVVPDEVVITLGIDSRDKDIVKAKADNDAKLKKILEISKTFKIESKYIQTDYLNIQPGDITQKAIDYSYNRVSEANLGYIVQKKLVITLKDMSKFEAFLTEVVKNGAEYVQGVEFRTTELRKHKDKARELAVKAAKEKADAMTSALGQKAGKAVSIKEEEEYYWSWQSYWYNGFYGSNSVSTSNVLQNVSSPINQSDMDGIAPGQIKVHAKVNIDFTLN